MWEKVYESLWFGEKSVVEHTYEHIIKPYRPYPQPGHKSAGKVNRLRDDAVKHIFEALHSRGCYGVVGIV